MARSMFSIEKPTHNILTGKRMKRRKAFKTQTKKKEWMKSGGHNPDNWRTGFIKTSKCRHCHRTLHWGDRSYEFDHKDNNSANNGQKNCYLVCVICHSRATVIKTKKTRDIFGMPGRKIIKKKVGYKKRRGRKKQKRKKPRRQRRNLFGLLVYRKSKFKMPRYF